MEKGLVSVITPTYNCVDFIGETIESVQSQSYQHWRTILELLLLELRQWN